MRQRQQYGRGRRDDISASASEESDWAAEHYHSIEH